MRAVPQVVEARCLTLVHMLVLHQRGRHATTHCHGVSWHMQDVMQYANVNILPLTAHHGAHESLFSTESPRDDGSQDSGSGLKTRLTRSSTMDTWLPVLACVCRNDIEPGDFLIAGPDPEPEDEDSQLEAEAENREGKKRERKPRSVGVGDPETLELDSLKGVEISDEMIQMVWESCHQAVKNYLP